MTLAVAGALILGAVSTVLLAVIGTAGSYMTAKLSRGQQSNAAKVAEVHTLVNSNLEAVKNTVTALQLEVAALRGMAIASGTDPATLPPSMLAGVPPIAPVPPIPPEMGP